MTSSPNGTSVTGKTVSPYESVLDGLEGEWPLNSDIELLEHSVTHDFIVHVWYDDPFMADAHMCVVTYYDEFPSMIQVWIPEGMIRRVDIWHHRIEGPLKVIGTGYNFINEHEPIAMVQNVSRQFSWPVMDAQVVLNAYIPMEYTPSEEIDMAVESLQRMLDGNQGIQA